MTTDRRARPPLHVPGLIAATVAIVIGIGLVARAHGVGWPLGVAGLACLALGALAAVAVLARWQLPASGPGARAGAVLARALWPWLLVAIIAGITALVLYEVVDELRAVDPAGAALGPRAARARRLEPIVWRTPRALWLLGGAALVGIVAFHLQRRRAATMGFSNVGLVGARGAGAWLGELPAALRVVAVAALAVALARPETERTITHSKDTIDIMIVIDMSKSMEDTDMPRDRLDAAQRVIRRFLQRTKTDRIGLVVFGQVAMLQCPLTEDSKLVEQIVSDLAVGDVPEMGTAIGDGLGLALAQLRRGGGTSKVVILLSDGDNNSFTRFEPDQAARAAKEMGVKVYTLLVGREESDLFGGMSVNPATLRSIAQITGGEFFRASDYEAFRRGFETVRDRLDKKKTIVTEKITSHQLFLPFAIAAAILFALERLLASTRLRRLP